MKEVIENKEWFTIKEVVDIVGYNQQKIARLVRNGNITNVKKEGKRVFIHKESVIGIVKINNKLKDYYSQAIAAEKIGKTKHALGNMIYRNQFKDTFFLNGTTYVSKAEVDSWGNISDTISLNEAYREYKILTEDIKLMIEKKLLKANQINGYWYIKKESIESLIEDIRRKLNLDKNYNIVKSVIDAYIDDFTGYPIEVMADTVGMSLGQIRKLVREGKVKAKVYKNKYFIPNEEVDKFFYDLEFIKKRYFNTEEYMELWNVGMKMLIKTHPCLQETLKKYSLWGANKIVKSKALKKTILVNRYLDVAKAMAESFSDEIYTMSDDEIRKFSDELNLPTKCSILHNFIRHLNDTIKCNLVDLRIKRIGDTAEDNDGDKEIYTSIEWYKIKEFLNSTENHIDKAKKDKAYAQVWLYSLLHLSLPWRSSTFLELPGVDVFGVLGIDMEMCDYSFSKAQSQKIINAFRRKCLGVKTIIANKNRVKVQIVITPNLLVSTATAIAINEMHRRAQNKEKLFFYSRFRNEFLKVLFPENFVEFKSRKCNKTLMTRSYATAVNKKGRAVIAYNLESYGRSHKVNLSGAANDVTATYLVTENTDGDARHIAKHLFERGVFGWQIQLMLDLISNEADREINYTTACIKAIRKEFNPLTLEGISGYLNTMTEEANNLVQELLLLGVDKIKEKLIDIGSLRTPGILEHVQCLVGVENCHRSGDDKYICFGCRYNIPTNYVLEIVNNRLNEVTHLLVNTDDSDKVSRIKYTHLIRKLLFILLDFRRSSKKMGDDYLTSFIDLDELRKKIQFLEKTKYLDAEV